MEVALRKERYRTLDISYPSRRGDLGSLAQFIDRRLAQADIWITSERVHFVTHSMGGLVAARYLHDFSDRIPAGKVGRVVMLAPPSKGSELADFLSKFPPYTWLYGPAGRELTTMSWGASEILPFYEVGVIAGTTGWPYILGSALIQKPHDGRVAVERTIMDGMKDHLILLATHTFIAWKPAVHRQVIHFLKDGAFERVE